MKTLKIKIELEAMIDEECPYLTEPIADMVPDAFFNMTAMDLRGYDLYINDVTATCEVEE